MLIRKGDKLIRIVYSTCPCTLNAIKPLAQELAAPCNRLRKISCTTVLPASDDESLRVCVR